MTEAHPSYIAAIRDFQEFFGDHFPELAKDGDLAGFEMQWLASRMWGNPTFPTVRRTEALKHLSFFMAAASLSDGKEVAAIQAVVIATQERLEEAKRQLYVIKGDA